MKRKSLVLIILILPCLCQTISFAQIQVYKRHDEHGNYSGKCIKEGNKTKIYDSKNNYTGCLKRSRNKIREYKANGNFVNEYREDN